MTHFSTRFDQMFTSVVEQLQPVCVAEQKFLTSFFHFEKPSREDEGVQVCHLFSLSLTTSDCQCLPQDEAQEEAEEDIDISLFRKPPTPVLKDIHSVGGGLQGLLAQLFQSLLPEVEGLIQYGERLDS